MKPPCAPTDFALDFDREARSLRERLELTDDMPWRWNELSFGERKKLQIACALWQRPDVLAIDEPTNHLDTAARRQLESLLREFDGIGILVSHDRGLLDALVDRCASFEATGPHGSTRITIRPGGYTAAHAQAELERRSIVAERSAAKAELARLTAEREARAREAARAGARRSKRGLGPKDKSARAKIDLAIWSGQDGARGRARQPDGEAPRHGEDPRRDRTGREEIRRRPLPRCRPEPSQDGSSYPRLHHPLRARLPRYPRALRGKHRAHRHHRAQRSGKDDLPGPCEATVGDRDARRANRGAGGHRACSTSRRNRTDAKRSWRSQRCGGFRTRSWAACSPVWPS